MVNLGGWTLGAPPAKILGITKNPSVITGPGSSNRVLCFSCLPAPRSHSSQHRISSGEGFNAIMKRGEPPIWTHSFQSTSAPGRPQSRYPVIGFGVLQHHWNTCKNFVLKSPLFCKGLTKTNDLMVGVAARKALADPLNPFPNCFPCHVQPPCAGSPLVFLQTQRLVQSPGALALIIL